MNNLDINTSARLELISQIVKLTNDRYLCVDIGMMFPSCVWCIVEVNPPYALDEYQIPMDNYISFCVDACMYLNVYHKHIK